MIKNSNWAESSIHRHSKKGRSLLNKSTKNPSSRYLPTTSISSSPPARIKPYACGIFVCILQSNYSEMKQCITLATVKTIVKIYYLWGRGSISTPSIYAERAYSLGISSPKHNNPISMISS